MNVHLVGRDSAAGAEGKGDKETLNKGGIKS